jgi:hypothetical protein
MLHPSLHVRLTVGEAHMHLGLRDMCAEPSDHDMRMIRWPAATLLSSQKVLHHRGNYQEYRLQFEASHRQASG